MTLTANANAGDVCDALAIAARRLAPRISDGATLLVVAPGIEDHARHVAVEFVHPATMGAMAVPAISVEGSWDVAIDSLRHLARPGDVVVSLGSANALPVAELSVRCVAWGADHIHIGWHDPNAPSTLDPRTFLIRVGNDSSAEHALTRSYHLLWELTFICLQNKRLTKRPTEHTTPFPSCSVCADDATTAEVIEPLPDNAARVRTACGPLVVDVSLVDDVRTNDLVLVHAGVALRRLDPAGL